MSPSGKTHKTAGLGVAWLGHTRTERQWQVGIHCPALGGVGIDREEPVSDSLCTSAASRQKWWGKVLSAASAFPKAI